MYWKMRLVCVAHAVLGMSFWYQMPILNPIEDIIQQFANETLCRWLDQPSASETQISTLWSFLNTIYIVGYALNGPVLPYFAEKFGRRATVMPINSLLMVLAAALALLSKIYGLFELLLLSRLITGFSDGMVSFVFVYIMECCDPEDGRVASTYLRIGDASWYVLSALVGLPELWGTEDTWHYMLALTAIPYTLYAIVSIFVPESPKHLLITLGKEEECRKAIQFYQGPTVDVEAIMDEYRVEALHNQEGGLGLMQVLTVRHLRWPFAICVIASLTLAITGYDIDNSYSTMLLAEMGVESAALYNLVFLKAPILLMAIVSIYLVQWLNSRTFLLSMVATGSVAVSLMCLSEAIPQGIFSTVLLIVSLALELTAIHVGMYVLPKVLPGEICPQSIRSITSAYSAECSGLAQIVITMSFPPLSVLWGSAWTLAPLVILSWITCIWLMKYLPETRNRTLNQIIQQWMDAEQVQEMDALIDREQEQQQGEEVISTRL